MFRQTSYADGGIVYFGDPAKNPDENQLVSKPIPERETSVLGNIWRKIGGEDAVNAIRENYYKSKERQNEIDAGESMFPGLTESMTPTERQRRIDAGNRLFKGAQKVEPMTQEQMNQKAKEFKAANAPDSDAAEQADRMTGNKVEPNKVPANPNKQASNTNSAQIKPPVAPAAPPVLPNEFKSQFDTSQMGKVQSPEEVYAQQQKIRALTGVSDDPMKDIKERYAKLEEKRAMQEAQDPFDSLMTRLSAFSQAKATDGFGAQMGASSDAGQKFDKEQQALRDKQATEMNALQLGIAKEDDARKRGDAKGIEDAIAKQKEAQFKLYELQNQERNSAAVYMNAQTNVAELPIKQQTSNAQMISAQRGHAPNAVQSLESLYARNPELAKLYLGQGKVGVMTLEEAYKAVVNDPRNMGLTDAQKQQKAAELHKWANGGQGNQQSTAKYPPTTVKDGKTLYLHPDNKYYPTKP
jgi:hypothetical protein